MPGTKPSPREAASPKGLFPTTRWTIVRNLNNGERSLRFIAWDEFCASYQRPLYVWLHSKTGKRDESEELVQSFLAKLHLKEHAIDALHPAKGQLRTWLLSCLRRHWIDAWRSREPDHAGLPAEIADEPSASDDLYDREWAFSLSRRVLGGLRDEYLARAKSDLFEAMLQSLDDPDETPREVICATLEMSPNHFAVAFMRFRERLAVRLREDVAATLLGDDPHDIDAELRHLIGILSRHGGLASAAITGGKA